MLIRAGYAARKNMVLDILHRTGFAPITYNGTKYSLHHLQPFKKSILESATSSNNIIVRVRYHSHVFSIEPNNPPLHVLFTDEGGRHREFCPSRYGLSKTLTTTISDIIEQNTPSWVSHDNNQRNHLAICDHPLQSSEKYVIYYALHPSRVQDVDVELYVKSAYLRYIDFSRTGKRERINALIRRSHFKQSRIPK